MNSERAHLVLLSRVASREEIQIFGVICDSRTKVARKPTTLRGGMQRMAREGPSPALNTTVPVTRLMDYDLIEM